jgi:hypothetical protein
MKKIIAAALACSLAACVPTTQPTAENVTTIQLSSSDWQRVQNAVKANLIDSESARFGPRTAFSYTENGIRYRGVCGYVNARNRMGGYVGDKGYIAIASDAGWMASGPGDYYHVVCQQRYGITPPQGPVLF